MADANDYKVHDLVQREEASFLPGDFGRPQTVVTFYVGKHGPFRLVYPQGQGTSDKINSDIQHKIVELRRVDTANQ